MPLQGRSNSIDVKAANSKLAQLLRSREEEEQLLQVGKRKTRKQGADANRNPAPRKSRLKSEPDFSAPTPLVDRPKTETGHTSFHFAYTSVSKEGSPTLRGTKLSGFGSSSSSPGADHSKYIERDGAAEASLGAEHASYIEREGAAELALKKDDPEIGEALTDEEKAIMGGRVRTAAKSIFSNISENPYDREEYWRAVHRSEREAKKHSLILHPESSPRWWANLDTADHLPDAFLAHCLAERDRHNAWARERANDPGIPDFKSRPYSANSERAGEALNAAAATPGWNSNDAPIEFKSGRGGRVQYRFVAELPHELSAEDRALIVQNFCDHLGSFSKDEDGNPIGMMYTAVIHAPDAHNDKRNYHLHVIAHDRPAKWLEEYRQWDFEVQESYQDPGSRKERVRYPFRQNKIGEVSQTSQKTGRPNSGQNFIPAMRRKFADINNAVLKMRGVPRQLDPRRYTEMGIERTPTAHLGTNAAALEAMGVPTIVGSLNAIAIWNDAKRSIDMRATAVDADLKTQQRDYAKTVREAISADPRSENTRKLRSLVAERDLLISTIAKERRDVMLFDHYEAKAKSRAVRTRETCIQLLNEADRIPGIHSDAMLAVVKKRYQEAQDHIERVNKTIEEHRPGIKAAAADIVAREDRIQEIDRLLAPLRATAIQDVERERERRQKEDRARAAEQKRKADARGGATRIEPVKPKEGRGAPSDKVEKENTNARNERSEIRKPNKLAVAAGLRLPSYEPALVGSRSLHTAGTLAGVRGLSSIGMVWRGERAPVLLQDVQPPRVGDGGIRSGNGSGDSMRRTRDGDPADAREDGGSRRNVSEASLPKPRDKSKTPTVLSTPSMHGVPLVEPSIPHNRDAITPAPAASNEVPEGLSPTREEKPAEKVEPVTIELEDEAPAPSSSSNDKAAQPGDTEAEASSDKTEAASNPFSPENMPTDRRRNTAEPTLFPVEKSSAPIKAGTTKAEYADWDTLLNRIAKERIPVTKDFDKKGRVQYDVPSLDEDDKMILYGTRFAKRTTGRLAAINGLQEREIDRLVRWITKTGRDPEKLQLEGRTAKILDASQAVRGLMSDWKAHPKVRQALRDENTRRMAKAESDRRDAELKAQREAERAAQAATKREDERNAAPAGVAQVIDSGASNRAERLAQIYPDPRDAATPQVRRLIELLREDADEEKIREAAQAVQSDPAAREDVHKHRVELAQTYNAALDSDEDLLNAVIFGTTKRGGR